MSAGTAYSKRYGGGFLDLPTKTTPIDQQFLNAVEAALLQLIGAAPTADGQVAQWDNVNTRYGPALLLNKNIDPAAGIVKSKLDLTGANGIVNADIAGAAAIARSKLNFGAGLVDADIAAAAAIAKSKLAALAIADADVAAGAAISRTKLLRSFTKVYQSAAQTCTNATSTVMSFNTEAQDDENLHSNVTNPERITFPADGGFWLVGGRIQFLDPIGASQISMRLLLNGATEIASLDVPRDNVFGTTRANVSVACVMAPGDFFHMQVTQNSGGNLDNVAGADATNIWAVRL